MRKRVGQSIKNFIERIKTVKARHELFKLHGFNSFAKINIFTLQRTALLPDIKIKKTKKHYTLTIEYTKKTKQKFQKIIENLRRTREEILSPECTIKNKQEQIKQINHLIEFFQGLLKQGKKSYVFSEKPKIREIQTSLKKELNKKIEEFKGRKTIKKVFPK